MVDFVKKPVHFCTYLKIAGMVLPVPIYLFCKNHQQALFPLFEFIQGCSLVERAHSTAA